MGTIAITTKNRETYSAVSNFFIDYYMTEANGEFVKVYLYLVRLLQSGTAVTVADIADHFNLTEKDICRAIRYWIRQGVLQLEYTSDRVLTGITLLPLQAGMPSGQEDSLLSLLGVTEEDAASNAPGAQSDSGAEVTAPAEPVAREKGNAGHAMRSPSSTAPVLPPLKAAARDILTNEAVTADYLTNEAVAGNSPANEAAAGNSLANEAVSLHVEVPKKTTYKPDYIASKKEDEDFGNLLYQTEIYFGKPLTQTDVNTLIYIYDGLSFPPELLEYLVEYCVTIEKKSCRYIEAVAIEWYKNGIRTVEDAKIASRNYNSIYVAVLKQLGIPRRVPTPAETEYIDTWYHTYAFTKNIILEACKRAISSNPHSANFHYVNGILESWHRQNVHKIADIEELDRQWAAEKKKRASSRKTSKPNQFNDYQSSTDKTVVDEFENLFLQETNQ